LIHRLCNLFTKFVPRNVFASITGVEELIAQEAEFFELDYELDDIAF